MPYILSLLLLLSLLNAKEFSVVIDKPFNDALFDITQDYDRQISAVGFSTTYKESVHQGDSYSNAFDYLSSISDSHGKQIHLIKVDNKAKVTLNKSTKLAEFSEAVALVKTPSNGYFIGGYTLSGSLIILNLDANGNLIFKKKFGTKNYDRMNKLILLSDGGVLAIGSSATTRSQVDPLFQTGLGLNDIFITRFSKNGTKIWSKKYGTQHDDVGVDAVEARDGSIIVVSTTHYELNKNLTLMRITETGDKVWLKQFKSENNITPYKIIKLRDNNFLLSLSKRSDMNKEQIRLIKFNLQNNIIIDKEIYTSYSSVLKDIKEYSNGAIVGVGFVADAYNTDALVMLLDNSLNMIHQEHFGEENYDVFNAVTILNNSQAAIAGIKTSKNSQESNMWIIKINNDGSIVKYDTKETLTITPSKHSKSLYNKLQILFKNEIAAGKIKIKKDLTIEFLDNSLYFEVSKYKLTPVQKTFLNKFSKKLIPFLKSNLSLIKNLEINGHTSSEWASKGLTTRYLNNEKLSMNRSYSTLSYLFKHESKNNKLWLSEILKGSGVSYSENIMQNNTEDKKRSRRISFKIILK